MQDNSRISLIALAVTTMALLLLHGALDPYVRAARQRGGQRRRRGNQRQGAKGDHSIVPLGYSLLGDKLGWRGGYGNGGH